jgi:hypothetical protein
MKARISAGCMPQNSNSCQIALQHICDDACEMRVWIHGCGMAQCACMATCKPQKRELMPRSAYTCTRHDIGGC